MILSKSDSGRLLFRSAEAPVSTFRPAAAQLRCRKITVASRLSRPELCQGPQRHQQHRIAGYLNDKKVAKSLQGALSEGKHVK